MLTKALFLAATAYAIVCAGVYLLQDKLLYHPSQILAGTPANIGLEFEDVRLNIDEQTRVHGWYVPAATAQSRGTLLFFHGNAGNISDRMETLRLLNELGLAVLIMDYPGYGQSDGSPGEAANYATAQAAWNHVIESRRESPARVVVFGRSLGAAMAIWLAAKHPPGALIIESAFTSLPDIAASVYPFLPVRWLARTRYPNFDTINSIKCPVLVAHGPGDSLIPYEHGLKLYANAPSPKRFLMLAGGHNDGFLVTGPPYAKALSAFLAAAQGQRSWDSLTDTVLEQQPR